MANPASQTAVGPMVIVAVEQYCPAQQRLVDDKLAYQLLPASTKLIVRMAQWPPARKLLMQLTEKTALGIWGSMLCRKRYIDDIIHQNISGIDAVVILGAGLDTRAYRMTDLVGMPVFEVDLPENSAYKQKKLQEIYGKVPASVQFVPIDFEQQDLETVLKEHGYRDDQKTFFVWEAVTQYLTEEAVRRTFTFLSKAATGSRLVFTYVRQDFLDGVRLYGAEQTYQRFRVKQQLWHFGMLPEQVAPLLQTYNWREGEQMGSQEFSQRYVIPTGRDMPISGIERLVYAEKV